MPPKSKAKGKKATESSGDEPIAKSVAVEEAAIASTASKGPDAKVVALTLLGEELWGASSKVC